MLLTIYVIVNIVLSIVLVFELILGFTKKVDKKNNDFLKIIVKSFLIITMAIFVILNILTEKIGLAWFWSILLVVELILLIIAIYLYKNTYKIKSVKKTEKNTNKVNLFSRIKEKRKDNIENKRFIKRPKRGGYISIKTEELEK